MGFATFALMRAKAKKASAQEGKEAKVETKVENKPEVKPEAKAKGKNLRDA